MKLFYAVRNKAYRCLEAKLVYGLLSFILVISVFCLGKKTIKAEETSTNEYTIMMKRDILCLMLGYPEFINGLQAEENGQTYLVMKSGRRILYDDKKQKQIEEKFNNTDLQDMLEQIYPLSHISTIMEENYDPGRLRVYSLLKEVYGENKKQVENNLTNVKVGYQNFLFNKNNNASESLKNVMRELILIEKSNPNLRSLMFPASGTFNYRVIAGTGRLSPHSYGTAIDLKSDKRDYWKWASRKDGQKRLNAYPRELVETFEKYNFIWGGKWGHFDILHFEYRPELIIKARFFSDLPTAGLPWYKGAPIEDEKVKDCIKIIDGALGD